VHVCEACARVQSKCVQSKCIVQGNVRAHRRPFSGSRLASLTSSEVGSIAVSATLPFLRLVELLLLCSSALAAIPAETPYRFMLSTTPYALVSAIAPIDTGVYSCRFAYYLATCCCCCFYSTTIRLCRFLFYSALRVKHQLKLL
jgi:hypothetical protein